MGGEERQRRGKEGQLECRRSRKESEKERDELDYKGRRLL